MRSISRRRHISRSRFSPEAIEALIAGLGRTARQRSTLWRERFEGRELAGRSAVALDAPVQTPASNTLMEWPQNDRSASGNCSAWRNRGRMVGACCTMGGCRITDLCGIESEERAVDFAAKIGAEWITRLLLRHVISRC